MSNEIPQADATTIVIFGATGDLTHRKLIPALYRNRKRAACGTAPASSASPAATGPPTTFASTSSTA